MKNWKEVPYFDGYIVSNTGIVRSFRNHNSSDNYTDKKPDIVNGYERVKLYNNGNFRHFFVHRLVAELFIPNPNNKSQVNHKDGDKRNNHSSNLEWVTVKENINHAIKLGISGSIGETNHNSKLSENDVLQIRSVYGQGWFNMRELAGAYKVSLNQISYIINRKSWSHI